MRYKKDRALNYYSSLQGVGAPIGELTLNCAERSDTDVTSMIGAIIVSGMTQDLDHTIISVALQELLALRLI